MRDKCITAHSIYNSICCLHVPAESQKQQVHERARAQVPGDMGDTGVVHIPSNPELY
ncbi:hypothetical protein ccbrp13_27290 [Ktedonobacteria bacterium brp13]|nr:hypothetical protein ccbrp13_27290 [Ktedonobacteria bacterium brp13]